MKAQVSGRIDPPTALVGELRSQGRAQATIRSRWIALRSFYAWAADEDEIDENPMLGVKVERAEPPPPKFPGNDDPRCS